MERLDLDVSRRFREYSKGNKQKVGLVVALQHKPDLLILDEPTSGLDPLMQQTFFELIREARAEGRTVFLSSHIIDEVDRTCDRVGIIREGRLVQVDRIETIRRLAFHHVELTFGDAGRRRPSSTGWPASATSRPMASRSRMRVAGPVGAVLAAAGPARAARRRQPRAEPGGRLPRPVRPARGRGRRWPLRRPAPAAWRPPRSMPWSRVMGLRSIYAKTTRDSRRAALLVGIVGGLFMFGTGAPYGRAPEFSTPELRQQFINGILSLPAAIQGLLGTPINLETLGGFLSWRVGNIMPVLFGLWPVLALSGTLAGEAAKGSLDLLASTPQSRRSIALQKLARSHHGRWSSRCSSSRR